MKFFLSSTTIATAALLIARPTLAERSVRGTRPDGVKRSLKKADKKKDDKAFGKVSMRTPPLYYPLPCDVGNDEVPVLFRC